jgi:MGT family glycosyltransferase
VSRFLFVVPPLAGHINPAVSVAEELAARGHEIAWAAHERIARPLLPEGATVFPLPETISDEALEALHRPSGTRWIGRLRVVWEELFLPLARAMLPEVEATIEAFRPAALLVDQYAVGGALAARRSGLPWATSAAIWFPLSPFLDGLPAARNWLVAQLDGLQREARLEPVVWPDRSPQLVIVYTTRDFVGEEPPLPEHYRFVGPAISGRPEPAGFPWDALLPARRLFVSLGSVQAGAGARFYEALVEAFGGGAVQVVAAAPPELFPAVPGNFVIQGLLPQVALLPHVDAVVCHGGFNTVSEALAHGLPLVVAPIADDQTLNAHCVVQAGAGVRLRFGRIDAGSLRQAASAVLEEPSYRDAARRIAGSFREAGGAASAAAALEALAAHTAA